MMSSSRTLPRPLAAIPPTARGPAGPGIRRAIAGILTLSLLIPGVGPAAPPEGVAPESAVLLPPAPPAALRDAADSTVAAMVAAVAADTITAFLERLTGEVPVELASGPQTLLTRYAPHPGAELAAEFLRGVFESYGYAVESHYFRFLYNLQSIVVGPGSEGVIVGNSGRALRTGDGSAWHPARTGIENYEGSFNDVDLVSGSDYVTVGTLGFIATTTDGGLTWTPRASSATRRLSAVDVLPSGVGWIVGRDGVVLLTTDAGVTWSDQASGVSALLYDVVALGETTAIAVGAGGLILRTTDSGTSWGSVASGTTADLYRAAFAGASGWSVGAGGTIIATTDAGATWFPQTSGTVQVLNAVSFTDGARGWTVGGLGTILHTTNGGASWAPQTSPLGTTTLLGVCAVSASEAWVVGFGGALLRTTDGGSSWESRGTTILDGWENVVATLPGTSLPDEEMLLVGHYDSFSQIPDERAPGADDNGSGIAAIVEAARHLAGARYHRTLKFICFSGEEVGLLGSQAYAARAQDRGDNIVGVFNLDSVGWNDDYFRIFSDGSSTWLGNVAQAMASTYAPGLPTYHWFCDTCNWSDHWPFQVAGFDAIVGIETWSPAPPQHHTTADTLGLMDIPLVVDVTRIALATVAEVAQVDTSGASFVASEAREAAAVRLQEIVPNPAFGSTTARFDLPRATAARLAVYDVAGRLVAELTRGMHEAGSHVVTWDGRRARGSRVPAGVYFYRLVAGHESRTRKVVLLD